MKKIFYGATLAACVALASVPVSAVPISGSIAINPLTVTVSSGTDSVAGANGFTLALTFTGAGAGDLSGFSVATPVTVSNPYTFVPSTATAAFLTFTNGTDTAVFDLASSVVTGRHPTISGGTVDVFSLGTLHLTGFDDTAASFNFAATLSGTSWSASGTLQAPPARISTPEPATLALFGVGMLALAAVRRRKSA